jgi:cytoskeletal protein RodZ
MAAISETLRQARLRSGADLDLLAAKTKINPRYLQAIEEGNFEKLPGGIFARMFVKQYADALGLDGASFAEEFQRSASAPGFSALDVGKAADSRQSFQPTVPGVSAGADRGRNDQLTNMLSSLIWVVAAILVCAGAYYALAHLPSRTPDRAPEKPVQAQAPAQPAAAPPSPAPASPASATPAPSASTTTTPPAPASGAPIQLSLTAIEPVWVSATADGKGIMAEVLQPGTTKVVSATTAARLNLGNAGGIDITFNGKKLEPFGPKGQVRTIDFTSFGAQVVSRTPPPNPDPLR